MTAGVAHHGTATSTASDAGEHAAAGGRAASVRRTPSTRRRRGRVAHAASAPRRRGRAARTSRIGQEDEVPGEDRPTAGRSARRRVCATPSTMPPASVPHSEPRPPMTTASNAKISCVGPLDGIERRVASPRKTPGERRGRDRDRRRDARRACGCRCRRAAPSRGSSDGRAQRAAEAGAAEQELQPAEHARPRRANMISENQPTEIWLGDRRMLSVAIAPGVRASCASAENCSWSSVLDHDREPERRQQRRQRPLSRLRFEQHALEHEAERRHQRRSARDERGSGFQPRLSTSTSARNARARSGRRARG